MATQDQVGSICARALELAQLDSTFLSLARYYYNHAIDEISTGYDWPYYQTQASDTALVAGQKNYSLPADYNRSDTCYLIDANGNSAPVIIVSKNKFDRFGRSGTISGTPNIAYIDLSNREIVFDQVASGYSYRLTYFRKGTLVSEAGSDDTDEADFEDTTLLVAAIVAKLAEYRDDERAPYFAQKYERMLQGAKMNSADQDDDQTIEFARSKYRPGIRALRGGGFGSFE